MIWLVLGLGAMVGLVLLAWWASLPPDDDGTEVFDED